jgi:copper chaperone
MENINVKIEGMSCNHCVMAVKKELGKLGVNSLEVKIGQADMTVESGKISMKEIEHAIEEAGFSVII